MKRCEAGNTWSAWETTWPYWCGRGRQPCGVYVILTFECRLVSPDVRSAWSAALSASNPWHSVRTVKLCVAFLCTVDFVVITLCLKNVSILFLIILSKTVRFLCFFLIRDILRKFDTERVINLPVTPHLHNVISVIENASVLKSCNNKMTIPTVYRYNNNKLIIITRRRRRRRRRTQSCCMRVSLESTIGTSSSSRFFVSISFLTLGIFTTEGTEIIIIINITINIL